MKVAVVVPTLDEAAGLREALLALAPLRDAGHEVIVVDGGSADETMSIAQPLADCVLSAPRGRAMQMNTGASVATGDTLLFLHADTRLPATGIAAIDRARRAGFRWGRFDVELQGSSALLPVVAGMMNLRSALSGICTGDQAMFVERGWFESAGGFPALPLMEDVALSIALRRHAGPPARIRDRVAVSGRRWDKHGAWSTVASMWGLRWDYWRGVDAQTLARRYCGTEPLVPATLQVFAKAPSPGFVKTRLAAAIGDDAAAAAYRDLLLRTLDVAVAARRAGIVTDVELWADPGAPPGELAQLADRFGFALHPQRGATLGDRMHNAMRSRLDGGRPALLIGTDTPGVDVAYLARAASALQGHDAVVGPAEDGGYVLIGLARDVDVFSDVHWSTARVLVQSRAKLKAAGATWSELPTLFDIDTYEDLTRWQASEAAVDRAVAREAT